MSRLHNTRDEAQLTLLCLLSCLSSVVLSFPHGFAKHVDQHGACKQASKRDRQRVASSLLPCLFVGAVSLVRSLACLPVYLHVGLWSWIFSLCLPVRRLLFSLFPSGCKVLPWYFSFVTSFLAAWGERGNGGRWFQFLFLSVCLPFLPSFLPSFPLTLSCALPCPCIREELGGVAFSSLFKFDWHTPPFAL